MNSNNKTIAKNTIYLYFRMMFTMLVSLYTSRVVLKVLGVEDFGTYQAVGGIVIMLSFVNSALSNGTSRFLTYELGTGDYEKLRKTFSSLLSLHIIIAIITVLVAETIGLWFVMNKLVIPDGRMEAALFVYHMSVLTSVITITQVPYNATIISHEKMGVYAYLSIFEVVTKLLIVYVLILFGWDKLKLYALLLALLQIATALYYRHYCVKNFSETRNSFILDKSIVKEVLGYSIWNLISSISIPLKNQGLIILINMFFSPAVVTARALANQVNMAANQFIQNFRTAANPQIVKRLASGNIQGSKALLLSSTKYSYFMMLALCLPICLLTEPLLKLWLGDIPEYTVIFLQLTIITSLFQVFDNSFYTALYAVGRIKENALISPMLGILTFPITYFLFKLGHSPIIVAWILLIMYVLLGVIVKPILIVKYASYKWREITDVFIVCFKVTLLSSIFPMIFYFYKEKLFESDITSNIILLFICLLSTTVAIWYIGLEPQIKSKIISAVKKEITKSIKS